MDYYSNCNTSELHFRNVPAQTNLYDSGSSSLPPNLNWKVQISENEDDADSEKRHQTQEDHCRNVGQEKKYVFNISESNALESAPRERKRWVRPPLVGQAANSDSSNLMKEISLLETFCKVGTNDELQDDHNSIENQNESSELYNVSGEVGISPEIQTYSIRQGRTSEMMPSQNNNRFCSTDDNIIDSVGSGRPPSPSSVSSVTSSRRLEWDSGADVGYQNYQPDNGEPPSGGGLSTIERLALTRGCSAALRLEPEGIAGSMQQLPVLPASTGQSKLLVQDLKSVFKAPMAVSTPVDKNFKCTVSSSATGTESESEITPIVTLPTERYLFHKEESAYHPATEENRPTVNKQVILKNISSDAVSKEEKFNVLSKKMSSSLTDLNENDDVHKNSLPRSQSHLSILSKNDYGIRTFPHYQNNSSFPLRHQYKRNNGLATCSASSSSIATVVPKQDSPRMYDKLIQTSVSTVSLKHSVGIQVPVCDIESGDEAGSIPIQHSSKMKGSAKISAEILNAERSIQRESTDSDIINDSETDLERNLGKSRNILGSRAAYMAEQNFSQISQLQPENFFLQKHHDSNLRDYRISQNVDSEVPVCKGAHKRGSIEHHCSSATNKQILQDGSEVSGHADFQNIRGKLSSENNKVVTQNYIHKINHNEEETQKNSGTLDSITSSTQTTGSSLTEDARHLTTGSHNNSGRRGSAGVVGSANSFEYLPGDVYENTTVPAVKNLHRNTIAEDSSSESALSCQSAESDNDKLQSSKLWESPASSSLARDLEKGVTLLRSLIDSKSYSPSVKKRLIRQMVNRLIETNYVEDNVFISLDSNVPWVPAKPITNPTGFVSNYIARGSTQPDMAGEQKVRRAMERGEISGESAAEQCINKGRSKSLVDKQLPKSLSGDRDYFIADKCVGTVISETSGLSSTSERLPPSDRHLDSRAETTTITTESLEGSSVTSTSIRKKYRWKEFTTQSEREYEQRKHKSRQHSSKSVLLNLCETERENQLSWIRTEIHHLSNLKQLLEKQEELRNRLGNPRIQNPKESQKRKKVTVTSQNSDIQISNSEHESLRSRITYNSSVSGRYVVNQKSGIQTSGHSDKFPETSDTEPKIHNENDSSHTDKAQYLLHKNEAVSNVKNISSQSKNVFTQAPSSVNLCEKKSIKYGGKGHTKTADKTKLLEEKDLCVPISELTSFSSTNADTYELTANVTDGTTTGRINVYVQTLGGNSPRKEDSSRSSEVTENKILRKPKEINDYSEIPAKNLKSTENDAMCCCECKKLLTKIISETKSDKQRTKGQISPHEHAKSNNIVSNDDKQYCVATSGRIVNSKKSVNHNSRSCSRSSSGTLGDAVELTHDSEDLKRTSVATETVGNMQVQTTESVTKLPLIRPQWYSMINKTIQNPNKKERVVGSDEMKCPCCGALEENVENRSEVSVQDAGYWKCSKCLKLEQVQKHDRKCQVCGILESQVLNIKEDDVLDYEVMWKCSNCLQGELLNAERKPDRCIFCAIRQPAFEKETSNEVDAGVISKSGVNSLSESTPRISIKSPLGYILTLESSNGTVSSTEEKMSKKSLTEIKMKVPGRKRHSVFVEKKKEKFRQDGLEPRTKSVTKENQKKITKTRHSAKDNLHKSKIHRRWDLTLQEYLIKNRPDFIQRAEYRRQCLDDLAYLRELRQKSKLKLLALASHTASLFDAESASSVNTDGIPPPPLAIKRVFSQRTMRAQTERKYRNLPEVQNKKVEIKRKEDYRTNRLMAEIFARKLQKKVLKGEVNLSNSRSVITI